MSEGSKLTPLGKLVVTLVVLGLFGLAYWLYQRPRAEIPAGNRSVQAPDAIPARRASEGLAGRNATRGVLQHPAVPRSRVGLVKAVAMRRSHLPSPGGRWSDVG